MYIISCTSFSLFLPSQYQIHPPTPRRLGSYGTAARLPLRFPRFNPTLPLDYYPFPSPTWKRREKGQFAQQGRGIKATASTVPCSLDDPWPQRVLLSDGSQNPSAEEEVARIFLANLVTKQGRKKKKLPYKVNKNGACTVLVQVQCVNGHLLPCQLIEI